MPESFKRKRGGQLVSRRAKAQPEESGGPVVTVGVHPPGYHATASFCLQAVPMGRIPQPASHNLIPLFRPVIARSKRNWQSLEDTMARTQEPVENPSALLTKDAATPPPAQFISKVGTDGIPTRSGSHRPVLSRNAGPTRSPTVRGDNLAQAVALMLRSAHAAVP
jgi:hypothetical protein